MTVTSKFLRHKDKFWDEEDEISEEWKEENHWMNGFGIKK